jgi:hypothetical protein
MAEQTFNALLDRINLSLLNTISIGMWVYSPRTCFTGENRVVTGDNTGQGITNLWASLFLFIGRGKPERFTHDTEYPGNSSIEQAANRDIIEQCIRRFQLTWTVIFT